MKNVADIYPLSPMQELMLLHAISGRESDALFNQFCFMADGELDLATFRGAWQAVLDRHPALRTSFLWHELERPVQVVHKAVTLPVVELDWREKTEEERESELASLRDRDRRARILPSEAPLMRLTVIRWTEAATCVVWSSHHLIVDRWCIATILEDLFEFYRNRSNGRGGASRLAGSYRDYIAWIQAQDPLAAERYWRERLRGFRRATRITRMAPSATAPVTAFAMRESNSLGHTEGAPRLAAPATGFATGESNGAGSRPERKQLLLEEPLVAAVRAFARAHGLTTSVVFQGAWALLLAKIAGSSDVAFGAVVAGRPPELRGIESAVGSFINNLPVRVRLFEMPLVAWLRELKAQQQDRLPFEHVALTQIQAWCPLPAHEPLFDHLLVWLAPHETRAQQASIRMLPGELETAFPFTLAIAEGERAIELHAILRPRSTTVLPLTEILSDFQSILRAIISGAVDRPLSDLVPTVALETVLVEAEQDAAAESDARACRTPVAQSNGGGATAGVEPPLSAAMSGKDGAGLTAGLPSSGKNGAGVTARQSPAKSQPIEAAGREGIDAELLEDLLRSEWSALLGPGEIDPRDNFFDAGGTSLLAARLHARIEASTRMSIPLLMLFQDSTLQGMARTLQNREWPLIPGLVIPVQTQGSRPPLFCVASPEVNTIGYAMVARYLAADQPVYLLQTPPTDRIPRRLDPGRLLELAESYVDALVETQPTGPVQLLGMCSGAHIAVEMTRRLQRSGRTVRFLGLVNTWALYTRSNLYRVELMRQKLRYYGRRAWSIATLPAEDRAATLRAIARRKLGQDPPFLAGTSGEGQGSNGASSDMSKTARTNGKRSMRDPWLDDFGWPKDRGKVDPIEGRITVYRIRKTQVGRIRARDLGWGEWAEESEMVMLPSPTHDAILRQPYVQALAQEVESRLSSAPQPSSSP